MSKRFADTNKYKKPFIRSLPGAYKLLWDFLYLDCDHAGIWIVDFDVAQTYIGKDMPVSRETSLELFNKDEVRILEFDNGKKWFIVPFIEFQYSKLSEKNKAHISVISKLKKYNLIDETLNLIIHHPSPLQGAKEKDKEEEKEMVKDFGKSENLLAPQMFQIFKECYPKYPFDKIKDYTACFQIACKIAQSNGWKQYDITNGKMEETINIWKEIVRFSKSDNWFSTRSISDFNNEYQRLIQKIHNGSTTHQRTSENGSSKKGTSDARIDALRNW